MKVHKIFEEELLFGFWSTFISQIFSTKYFCYKNVTKIVRPFLAALSVNRLRYSGMKGLKELPIQPFSNAINQGLTLTVVLWPQASKNSQKLLRVSKKRLQLVLQGLQTFGGIFINKFPHKNIPDVFEINEDKINKNKCYLWILCYVFSFYVKEKFVGPVNFLQDQ